MEELAIESRSVDSRQQVGVRVGGQWVPLTHLNRIVFPDDGITKQNLIDYYFYAAGFLLRYTRARPLMMQRLGWRNGSIDKVFVQQRPSPNFPDWIPRVSVEMKGGEIEHVVCDRAATLIYLVNQGMITPHVWASRVDQPRLPDQVIFDLDPGEADFDAVRKTAFLLKESLEEEGLVPFVMTTGSAGLHVRSPIRRENDFDVVRAWARELADRLVADHPSVITTEISKAKRKRKVFIDTLRNSYGQNAVAPYAIRARAKAPIATPVEWSELGNDSISSSCFTIANIQKRMVTLRDPWRDFYRRARRLSV